MTKYRGSRLAGEMKKEIAEIIRNELKDPRLGFLSITGVEVAADLSSAKVYFSHLGDEASLADSEKALASGAGFIRRQLAHRLNTRTVPELTFLPDHSIEYGMKINKILAEVLPATAQADEKPTEDE